MKITREYVKGFIIGLILVVAIPVSVFAARTAAPVLTGLFSSTTLSVNLPAPSISLGNSTTTGSVYSNGGTALYFQVTALDGVGETIGSQLLGTSTIDEAHGWKITWTQIQGASGYRVYFSTSTPQAMSQYFLATTTNSYTFTSTSSALFVNAPTSNSAYAVNFNSGGTSWINGGNVSVGTTTNWAAQVIVSTSTAPQLALADTSGKAWSFRAINGALFIATTTPIATSSTSMLAFDPNGVATFSNKVVVTTANTATSTTQVGCIQTVATSTATPIKITFGTTPNATTTFSGTSSGFVTWNFGTCP